MTSRKYPQRHKKDTKLTIVHQTLGFGVPATSNPHHFIIVEIPRTNTSSVSIIENLGMQTHDHSKSTGGVNDGNKGWRLALRHALGDVAQHELF